MEAPLSLFPMILNILISVNLLPLAFQAPLVTDFPSGIETDKLALLAFKYAINEDPLGVTSSWNESPHFCNWRGVRCSQGRVTELDLTGQKLVGSISPHIGNLSLLSLLHLGSNSFKGKIPPEIGRLFQLRYLNLSYNALQGRIPSELAFCSNIQVIDFNMNNLTEEIPIELRNLSTTLRIFEVCANQLEGSIPQWLGNASSLAALSLAQNKLYGSIPAELGRLQKLKRLRLSLNNFTGKVPPSIFNISSLVFLSVAGNQLTDRIPLDIGFTLPNLQYLYLGLNHFYGEIPASLPNATELVELDMGSNIFSGVVPSNLGSLTNLKRLNLDWNQLEGGLGFLDSLTNCSNLRQLGLGYNHLKGELPASIANLSTKLEALFIAKNQISGKIPKEIGNLVGLTMLVIFSTNITGEIPSSIGKLQKLQRLFLVENSISGMIPSPLGNITLLRLLELPYNKLHGTIPPTLGNCSQLEDLSLEGNYLIGDIPKQLFNSSRAIYLFFAENSFTGTLPVEVGNMNNLVVLNVSHNQLSGGIPITLGKCSMLEELDMQDNLFEGGIPPSFSTLKSLQLLDLSRNNFSGQIPQYFQNFTLLQYLDLSFNNFVGEVPTGGSFKNANVVLVSGNQGLCGGIPQLELPPCEIQSKGEKRGKFHHLRVMIAIPSSCSILLIIALLVTFSFRRKYKRRASTLVQEPEHFPKISYAELSQATNEFSSSNLIGKGNFSCVYKGVLGDGMLVAVKVLNIMRKGASKSFIAECEVLKNIRHRNLIKIITVCSSIDFKGTDFKALVYKFMQNGSLEKWLHPDEDQASVHRLSLIQRLNIAIDVAAAIEYLHDHCQQSIIHGDLKPSNVLLDEDLVARVGDFGLARSLSTSQNQSSSIGIRGTIGYVAPEYGVSNMASKPGDIYSFGILLMEMITGIRPTDFMFKDSFTLHQFTKTALPEGVMDILEPSLQQEVKDAEGSRSRNRGIKVDILESLVAMARVGVLCSMESPSERMEMKNVVAELCTIRDNFLGNRI